MISDRLNLFDVTWTAAAVAGVFVVSGVSSWLTSTTRVPRGRGCPPKHHIPEAVWLDIIAISGLPHLSDLLFFESEEEHRLLALGLSESFPPRGCPRCDWGRQRGEGGRGE